MGNRPRQHPGWIRTPGISGDSPPDTGRRTRSHRLEITAYGEEVLFDVETGAAADDPSPAVVEPRRKALLDTLGGEFGVWPEGEPAEVGLTDRAARNLQELGYID